jgi:hypothetical protein
VVLSVVTMTATHADARPCDDRGGDQGVGMFWHGRQMYRRLSEEVRAAGLAAGGGDSQPVSEEDLAGLPATVQRFLRAMGVVGRPRDWSLPAHLTGRFRLQGQGSWMPAEVWQYNSALEVARIFHMRIDAGSNRRLVAGFRWWWGAGGG